MKTFHYMKMTPRNLGCNVNFVSAFELQSMGSWEPQIILVSRR